MPKVVSDFLKRQSFGNKARRTRMAKRVGAEMGNLDTEGQKPPADELVYGHASQRPPWRMQTDEHLWVRRRWTNDVDLAGQCFCNGWQ